MINTMSGSFNALASALVAKAATIDSCTATIAALTKTNAGLVETNLHLVAQLTAAKLPFVPPGLSPNLPTPAGPGRGKSTLQELPTVDL